MMYRSMLLLIMALVAVFAVGCAVPAAGSPGTTTPDVAGAETPMATPDVGVSPVATPATGTAGEPAEDILNDAVEWLATEANVAAEDLSFVEAERTDWTDSCFGLGGPAESCLAAITPGWRLVFEAGGEQYEVRTDEAGTSFRLAPQAS